MNKHVKSLFALTCALNVFSLTSARAEDATTNIISGTSVDNLNAAYYVGNSGTNNYLEINSAGQLFNCGGVILGAVVGADLNNALVAGTGSKLASNGNLVVGDNGVGNNLTIQAGGELECGTGYIGNGGTANNNTLLVTGPGSVWNALAGGFSLLVGTSGGNNSLIIADGGAMNNSSGGTVIGWGAGDGNMVMVTGTNSAWQSGGTLYVSANPASVSNKVVVSGPGSIVSSGTLLLGEGGGGNSLTVSNGGLYQSPFAIIGDPASSSGNAVLVTGSGSQWANAGTIYLGNNGGGNSLTIRDGGVVTSPNSTVGNAATGGNNSVLVSGLASKWANAGSLTFGANVGSGGNSLTIQDGGVVVNTFANIGHLGSGNSVLVTGSGSAWTNSTDIRLGGYASGNSLTISNGGHAISPSAALGYASVDASNNTVMVTGPGSVLDLVGSGFSFVLGQAGPGNRVTIADGGVINNNDSAVLGWTVGNNKVWVIGTNSVWQNTGVLYMGANDTSPNNELLVAGPGAVYQSSGPLSIGGGGGGNSLTISNGAAVNCYSASLGGNAAATNNVLNIGSGGTLTTVGQVVLNGINPVFNLGDGTTAATAVVGGVVLNGSTTRLNFNNGVLQANAAGLLVFESGSISNIGPAIIVTDYANTISNAIAGPGSLTKLGVGALSVFGTSTYSGATTVSNGTLLVNGSLANSTVTLISGTKLGGNGAIGTPVTVPAGAILQPGLGGTDSSPLTINNTLNLAGATIIAINRDNAPNASTLTGISALMMGGTLTVTNVGSPLQANDSFTLVSAGSAGGAFSTTTLPDLGAGLGWSNLNGTITVYATVSQTPTNVVSAVNGSNLELSWPADHIGWLAQSNSVSLADTNFWFDIAGSSTTNFLSIPIDTAMPSVFYRLRLP